MDKSTRNGKEITSFDGTKLYYEHDLGSKDLPTIVLLHGAGGELTAWNRERQKLQSLGYPVLAMDLRGHGSSGRPEKLEDYQPEKFAKDVNMVIKHEGLESIIVVGHSFGGIVAIIREGLFPQPRSQKLVLISASYTLPSIGGLYSHNPLTKKFLEILANNTSIEVEQGRPDNDSFIGSGDFDIPRIISDIRHTSPHSFFSIMENLIDYDALGLLANITSPTLIISGNEDKIFPLKFSEEMADRIKFSQLDVIDGANHIIVINNADTLTNHIHSFLCKE